MRRVFNELIGDDESETQEESLSEQWRELWQDALQEDDTTPVLAHLSEDDRKQVLTLIADFRKELDKRTIGPRGRQVLDHLMPHLLSDVCAREDAAVTLSRITALLVGIVTRTTYLELLSEFPAALKHLISLCAASPMIASQLARYPLLLDELLDPNTLYQPTATDAYRDELRQYLLRVPEDDEEQQLEALRKQKFTPIRSGKSLYLGGKSLLLLGATLESTGLFRRALVAVAHRLFFARRAHPRTPPKAGHYKRGEGHRISPAPLGIAAPWVAWPSGGEPRGEAFRTPLCARLLWRA